MWRLLPLCLLVACVATDPNRSDSAPGAGGAQARIVRALELPLRPPTLIVEGEPSRWTFQDFNVSGWVDEQGLWSIRSEVSHSRLRCASYEVGIQLGKGLPSCSNVRWLTDIDYVSRVRHCNGATRIHTGGGRFLDTEVVEAATCVRMLVRCEGC